MEMANPADSSKEGCKSDSDDDWTDWNDELFKAVNQKVGRSVADPEQHRLDRLKTCLEEGANIDSTDRNGNTALHIAIKKNYYKISQSLIKEGAQINIPNHRNACAITLAETLQRSEILRILKDAVEQQSKLANFPSTAGSSFTHDASNQKSSTSRDRDTVTKKERVTSGESSQSQISSCKSKHSKQITYPASIGSWAGNEYQAEYLVFTVHCASRLKQSKFLLSTEMIAAEKLDDVVLEYQNGNLKRVGRFVQIKSRNDHTRPISSRMLLESSGDFSVPKYFVSWRKIKANDSFRHIEVRNMILCTNVGFDDVEVKNNGISLKPTSDPDKCFEIETETAWYQFSKGEKNNRKLYSALRATSDGDRLAQELATYIHENKAMMLNNVNFQYYHVALVENVFDKEAKTFYEEFVNNKGLSPEVEEFRGVFLSKFRKLSNNEGKSEEKIWKYIKDGFLKQNNFERKFGQRPELVTDPKLTDSDVFCNHFVDLLKTAAENSPLKKMNPKNPKTKISYIATEDYVVNMNPKNAETEEIKKAIEVVLLEINKLAGHVLIEDKGQIKFSLQFLKNRQQVSSDMSQLRKTLEAQVGNEHVLKRFVFNIKKYKTWSEAELSAKDELPNDYVSDADIKEFFGEFFLATNQPTAGELKRIVRHKMEHDFNRLETDMIWNSLRTKITEWFTSKSRVGNDVGYLSHEIYEELDDCIKRGINCYETSGVHKRYCATMKEYDVCFKSTIAAVQDFLKPGESMNETTRPPLSRQILQLKANSGATLLCALRVYHTLQGIPKFTKQDSFVFMPLDDLKRPDTMDQVIATFGSPGHPDLLLVDFESNKSEVLINPGKLYHSLLDIVEKNSAKKIILITRGGDHSPIWSQIEHKTWTEASDKSGFYFLDHESCQKLLEKPVIKFQGQDKKTSLGKLLGFSDFRNIAKRELQDLTRMIDSDSLMELIRGNEIPICDASKGLHDLKKCYIDRIIVRHAVIKGDVIKDTKIPDILAISGISSKLPGCSLPMNENFSVVQNKTSNLSSDRSGNRCDILRNPLKSVDASLDVPDPKSYSILHSGREEEEFKALCEANKNRNIHWLKEESGKYIWQRSKGSISYLVQYRVASGRDDQSNRPGEKNLSEIELTAQDEPVIISAPAGMGKSTLLTNLASKIKIGEPDTIVLRIDLHRHTTVLDKWQEKPSYDSDEAIGYLVKDLLGCKSTLEKNILEKIVRKQRNVVLLFDGFDEISPSYESRVLNLLAALTGHGIRRLLVATRPHTRRELEKKLNTFSWDMQPLLLEQQIKLLTGYWANAFEQKINDRMELYAVELLGKMADSLNDRKYEFTGIPQHTKLVSEIFKDHWREKIGHFNSCETFLKSENVVPRLPQKIDLTYMYDHFVERKFDIFYKSEDRNLAKDVVKEDRLIRHASFKNIHEELALMVLFDTDQIKQLLPSGRCALSSSIIVERNGIITEIVDGRPHFGHQTFAEYFAATFFKDILESGQPPDQSVRKIVIADILLGKYYQTMRAFLNGLLPVEGCLHPDIEVWKSDVTEYRNEQNETIFHVAAVEGNDEIVRNFLPCLGTNEDYRKIAINLKNKSERTALCQAAKYGHTAVMRLLVDNGANLDSSDIDGCTALYFAAKQGELGVVCYLLDKGATIESANKYGSTPLHLAASQGHLEVVNQLLYKKANVNSSDSIDNTPLHWAAYEGQSGVVQSLLDKGAIIESANKDGSTPLHLAANQGHLEVVNHLLHDKAKVNSSDSGGHTPLHRAAYGGQIGVVQTLLDKGANIESANKDGSTPLRLAATQGHLEVVNHLLHKKANVDASNSNGCTLLHMAARKGKLGLVKLLLEKGADIESANKYGTTPLHLAAAQGHLEVVNHLLHEKANVESSDSSKDTPLHWAAYEGQIGVVQLLLDEGANIESANNDGWVPLHFAASKGHLDVVKHLLHYQANVDSSDSSGCTPLHVAAAEGHIAVVKFLLDKGANIDSADEMGSTPLNVAARHGHTEVED